MPVLNKPLAEAVQQRLGSAHGKSSTDLGFLADLPGTWSGRGFNMIARPDFQNGNIFLLQLNTTTEVLTFEALAGSVPNRGSEQKDIFVHAVTYKQQVSDLATHAGLHVEPGIWLKVPASRLPHNQARFVRQATIPHGDSLIAQSTLELEVHGPPQFAPVDSTPFAIVPGQDIPGLNDPNPPPKFPLGYLDAFLNPKLPDGLPAGLNPAETVKNPNVILMADVAGQNIVNTKVVEISTAATDLDGLAAGGIVNIPFITKNANAVRMDAIFWIETVQPNEHLSSRFLQLQYVQRVILDFKGVHWPHISVATLVKQ